MAVAERIIYTERGDLECVLPHRDVSLYLESVELGSLHVPIIGDCKAVSALDTGKHLEWFRGHFQDKPVLPGHYMLEFAAQLSAFVAIKQEHRDRQAERVDDNVIAIHHKGRAICLLEGFRGKIHGTVAPGKIVTAGLVDWIRERKRALFDVRLCSENRLVATFEIEGAILSTSR